jgi:hypothetical protein
MTPEIEAQLDVRMFLVNGLLLLQLGRFSKHYSPNVLRDGSLAVYETFATITSFPLMYFADDHGIPVRYLNLVAAATPSQKANRAERRTKKNTDSYRDWRVLQKEIAAYRILCDSDNENYSYGLLEELQKSFQAKRDPLLTSGGYRTHKDNDDDWSFPDSGHTYWNDIGTVFFRNMNANRDSPNAQH